MYKGSAEEDRSLRLYLLDLARSKPLSREREVALSARIREGDLQARNELVQARLRFVVEVAKQFRNRGFSLSELLSAGNLGLIAAAEQFVGSKGYKFITYAVRWVRHTILKAIAEETRTIRLPQNRVDLLMEIAKVSLRLEQTCANPPEVEEIAAELEASAQTVRDMLLAARPAYSLDRPLEPGRDTTLLSTLAAPDQDSPETLLLRDEARKHLAAILNVLNTRERRILRLYYGLDGHRMHTLDQIGDLFKLTRTRVGQLKEQGLSKLRRPNQDPAFRDLATAMEGV